MNISCVEIRNKFLDFFKRNNHTQIRGASIVPKNDPTLLFINSGMAPIKNYFTGVEKPESPRLCNVQPCIRTIDIDSIGDKHHLTSFQMLGSWSINDYFKEKAIYYAFKFLTEDLNIPKEKLYATVFSGDEELNIPWDKESYDFWIKVGMPENHIVKCPREDNFWGPTSETGPCGPCTEIFYDTGDGKEYIPGGEFDTKKRYIEIWNAGVFMQFNKNADGSFSQLPFKSVDTGAGLERLAMVLGGYSSVYDTDLLQPIYEKIKKTLGTSDKLSEREMLILTDHLRTASLILSEKVLPSNEGRGYTPRKLIRRCMMITVKNKVYDFDFLSVMEFILDKYKEIFPTFKTNREFVLKEFEKEYTQFKKIIVNGMEKLEQFSGTVISAKDAFELVTTYGLPFDIIKQYALDKGIDIEEEEFHKMIEVHKEKSKNIVVNKEIGNLKSLLDLLKDTSPTNFLGYDMYDCQGKILSIVKDESFCEKAYSNDKIGIVLDKTTMYAESGGQCSDTGIIYNDNFKFEVEDVKKTKSGVFLHLGTVINGEVKLNDIVDIEIDKLKRKNISKNHTAVHLLHAALRKLFGNSVHQSGSKVEDSKLRFDFNYENNITESDIVEIEKTVNTYIQDNIPRNLEIKKLSEAIESGAMALFESKYKDDVRVVSYGDISSELCGGTHVERTGDIGMFILVSAEGIGKGMKRITAVTGLEALNYVQGKIRDINLISKLYKVKPKDLMSKINSEMNKESVSSTPKDIDINDVRYIEINSGIKLGYIVVNETNKKINNEVIRIADCIKGIFACIIEGERRKIILSVADNLQNKLQANAIMKDLMDLTHGKGGGNKKVSSGGTEDKTEEILNKLKIVCEK